METVNMVVNELTKSEFYDFDGGTRMHRDVFHDTRTLAQCVRSIDGMMGAKYTRKCTRFDGTKYEETKTLREWIQSYGVEIKAKSNTLNIKAVKRAWADELLNGKNLCLYMNTRVQTLAGDGEKPQEVYQEYTKRDGSVDYKIVRSWVRVEPKEKQWNIAMVLDGLEQSKNIKQAQAVSAHSVATAKAIEHLYIFKSPIDKGSELNPKQEIDSLHTTLAQY